MNTSPFTIFQPYENVLSVVLLNRSDAVHTDDEIVKRLASQNATLRPTFAKAMVGRRAQGDVATSLPLVSLHQIHGNRTIILKEPTQRTEKADGCITDQPGLILTTRSADCQSLIVFDPMNRIVGTLHSGWKGLVCGAIPSFIKTWTDAFSSKPENLLVGIAPSLCKRCAEFSDPVRELQGIPSRYFDGRNADLPAIADWQLTESGVLREHIERSPHCSKCQNNLFWSYRGTDHDAVMQGWTNVLCAVLTRA